jgi:hypothetical protein
MTDSAADRLKVLAEALWNDRELGPKVQAKAKEMFPDAKTNADVVDPWLNPLREQNEKLAKDLEALRAERAEEKKAASEASMKRSLEESLDNARKAYNLTDEGFDKMVARMKETGNYTDPDAAAAWVASKNPPAPVNTPTFGPQALNFWGAEKRDESLAELHRDPQRYMDDQLAQFVRDPDRYVKETLGR